MNPILQGITLNTNLNALEALQRAVQTVDPESKDTALHTIRETLDAQAERCKAELTALCNLYAPTPRADGGSDAG